MATNHHQQQQKRGSRSELNGLSRKHPSTVDSVLLDGPLTDPEAGEQFVQDAFQIILEEAIKKGTSVNEKVCEWSEPDELQDLLDLELVDAGEPHEKLLERCRVIIRYSVKTAHPRFYNQLFAGLDHHSLVGRYITETLNTSQYTYEIAPVFVLMEEVVLRKLRTFVGWKCGDGIFCPGGSVSNMYAMNVARYKLFPEIKKRGLWDMPRLAVFTSEECHYSVTKGAAFQGLGTDNVYLVKADERGRMISEELEKQICAAKSKGVVPFLVSATAGTTVFGAFDPLPEIADICEKYGIWLHVDAAWGGSALISRKHCDLLTGIERCELQFNDQADSVAWNPHKMLMAGLQCSAFLLKDNTGLLKTCHSANASYLFQQDKFYNVCYDTGDQSLQCGRKVDCLKLWLMWKAIGTLGLEKRVDRAFACTRYFVNEMKKREGFRLLMEPQYVNVCFWYIPPSLRGKEQSSNFWQNLGKVAPFIKERMMKRGSMMVGYQHHGTKVNFFRQVLISPQVSQEDVDFVLDEIEHLGSDFQLE
ncbi:cysteine sulfinic acid decarboxylase isoform X2 [Stegostoma tigrinum]|uniref:cysteine sulfinic acid decarboxylase isoform X2 n=1 Tax=Stegostoma tigrinum TaxID=3053191 RepID=UPI002870861F|nr:cysteine sulfinic acid decarboxylase isoform X2 [Stegostoma tigrinum]